MIINKKVNKKRLEEIKIIDPYDEEYWDDDYDNKFINFLKKMKSDIKWINTI